jgi:hypothetical protein
MNTPRRQLSTALARIVVLLVCTTIGGAAVLFSIGTYASAVLIGNPLTFEQWRFDEYGILPTFAMVGIVTGTFGLGYLHVLVAYGLVLRRLPDFWAALPRHFVILYLGTTATSIIFMHARGGATATLEAVVIAVPLGFWSTVFLLWQRQRRKIATEPSSAVDRQ